MKSHYILPAFLIGTITTIEIVQPSISFAQNNSDINNIAKPVTVRIEGLQLGSGVIVNRQGNTYTILTNWHVVGHSGRKVIITSDNQTHEVSNVKQINNLDLAIAQFTSNTTYQVAEMANQQLTETTTIYITGYPSPRPGIEERVYIITPGTISGIKPADEGGYSLIYENNTRPGMSGSPIFNGDGKLVGIHGKSEGEEVFNPQTGTSETSPITIGGFKLGIHISNYLAWANNNDIAVNSPPSQPRNTTPNSNSGERELNRDESIAYYEQGQEYYDQGEYDKAIAALNQALEINPDYAEAYLRRGAAYLKKGELDLAIADFNSALKINPNDSKAHNNRGLAYYNKGDLDKAIADYNQALRINPDYAHAYNNRGNAYRNLEEYEKAIADYTEALRINPELAQAYNNRGNAYLKLEEYDKAIADYTEALRINPEDADTYNNRGYAYRNLEEYEKAIADYTEALRINPEDADTYNNRGNAYRNLEEYEKAIADYTEALRINPEDADTYNNRGNAYRNLEEYEKAIADYNQALRINPDYAHAYYNRGLTYHNLEEYDKALKDVEKAAQLYQQQGKEADYQDALDLIDRIKKLKR